MNRTLEALSISGFRYCKCLGVENQIEKLDFLYPRTIYKYLDMESAIKSLRDSYVYFQEPAEWNDGFEKRFYNAIYEKIDKDNKCSPKVYASCFTFESSSEPAWNTYSYNNKGLASKCVQFKLYRKLFRQALEEYAKKDNKNRCFYEGKIKYDYNEYILRKIHEPNSNSDIQEIHDLYFKDFNEAKYLSLLLLKRSAYKYENEVRYLFLDKNDNIKSEFKKTKGSSNKNNDNSYIKIPIKWDDCLLQIVVDENCSEIEHDLFVKECNQICANNSWKEFYITKSNIHENNPSQITIIP